MNTRDKITEAINQKQKIRFIYHNLIRIVEPHLLGIKTTGNVVLSAWQVGGQSETMNCPPWRNYVVSDISNFTITGEYFFNPRPGFNPNDGTMVKIIARV